MVLSWVLFLFGCLFIQVCELDWTADDENDTFLDKKFAFGIIGETEWLSNR